MILLVSLLYGFCALEVGGWGARGHRLISNLAFGLLTSKSKDYMSSLVRTPVTKDVFAAMSVWADYAGRAGLDSWSGSWHFTRKSHVLDSSVEFGNVEDNCLLSSVQYFYDILIGRGIPVPGLTKDKALKYLIHFVEDLHAPFHIGDDEDMNGIEILVQQIHGFAKVKVSHPTIHYVWDNLFDFTQCKGVTWDSVYGGVTKDVEQSIRRGNIFPERSMEISEIVRMSAQDARSATVNVGLIKEDGTPLRSGDSLSKSYLDNACPVAIDLVRKSAERRAVILNRVAEEVTSE